MITVALYTIAAQLMMIVFVLSDINKSIKDKKLKD